MLQSSLLSQSPFPLRPLEDADFDAVVDLINQYEPGGVTGDILRDRYSQWTEGDPRLHVVATSEDNEIIGYGKSWRRSSDPAGIFRVNVYVAPLRTGKGLGRALLTLGEGFAKENNGLHLIASAEETCKRGQDFAAKAGYSVIQHLFESRLDLVTFDPGPYVMAQACREEEGYRFPNLEDLGDTEENWRKLFELDNATDVDTPGSETWSLGTYEEYVRRLKGTHGYSLAGIRLAIFKDQWVGVNIVSESPKPGQMNTDYTGVRREFRGKGIAQVLKALGIQYAIGLGLQTMVTNNDERNAPMLAVNRKLGFTESPGFFVFRKELTATV